MSDLEVCIECGHVVAMPTALAKIEQLRSTLVTKRDMDDADALCARVQSDEEPFMAIDWRHDVAQAIANGRRVPEQRS